MTNIILCGGSGTRLWPLSRTLMPKQFVKLFEGKSLFQQTIQRNKKVSNTQFIISNAEHYFLAVDQLEESRETVNQYLLEPVGRNTAPAIALSCLALAPETLVLVTPSDHLIKDEGAYFQAIEKAKNLALKNNLVTFGITPQYPETGFGYIEARGENVHSFTEKPDISTAQNYLKAGNYYWNSGMFMFKAGIFLEELQIHAPALHEASVKAFENIVQQDNLLRVRYEDMLTIPENSIDYAVMEKSKKVKVVPSDFGWSDLGSFESLAEEIPSSQNNINIDADNNFILSSKQVVSIDIEDLIIIDTADALLVSKKGSSQKVKKAVTLLKEQNSDLPDTHLTVHRPWGTYTILDESDGYKVKRIVVKPGKRLSLQKHYHRSEHWVVVSGTAIVTKGTDIYTVNANESTYIPIGEIHRLENAGKIPLIMIEAQVGEYVGEDDIVRFEDDFKRKN